MQSAVAVLLVPFATGHVNLMWPNGRIQNPSGVPGNGASIFPNYLDVAGGCGNFACLWFNQGCQPGCKSCTDKVMPRPVMGEMSPDTCSEPNGTMPPTLTDKNLRTYNDTAELGDWTRQNPWRAPGYSPVFSPCGLAGGGATPGSWTSQSLADHIHSGAVTPPFIIRGFDGRNLPEGPKTLWNRGSSAEVAWSMFHNRGGGYAYRLCPKTSDGASTLTEECFQKHHLEFAGNQSWLQMGSNRSNRTAIEATRVSKGTFPEGSTWTKNPIPPCANADGSVDLHGTWNCQRPMWTPPLPDGPHGGFYGDSNGAVIDWAIHSPVEGFHDIIDSYGNVVYHGPCTVEQSFALTQRFQFNIFDEVVVPKDLPLGEYVLSFRYESEQTPQIWAQCADITIADSVEPTVIV